MAILVANPIVGGWINTFKIRTKVKARLKMMDMGLNFIENDVAIVKNGKVVLQNPISVNKVKWDKLCPTYAYCYPEEKMKFIRSDMLLNYEFVCQDRSFLIGPTIFAYLLDYFDLTGDLLQTHLLSQKSVAYLASLMVNNKRMKNFIVFGAGNKLEEYQAYLKSLGVDNVQLYAEKFTEIPLTSPIIEKVVGVFMSPPNSYSALSDPIDLICSCGGDLSFLEVLTESTMNDDGKKRVAQILNEQREVLKLGK